MKKTSGEHIMADEQSRDLEILFDEELSGERAELLKSKLAAQDLSMQVEWELLGLLRDGVQSWYKERCTDEAGNSCTCDVWDRIAPQLRRLPVPCEEAEPRETWIARALAGLSTFALRPVPVAAFAIVLLVGVAALLQPDLSSKNGASGAIEQLASNTKSEIQDPDIPEILKRSNNTPRLSGRIAFGHRGVASGQAALVGLRSGDRWSRTDVYSSSPIDSDSASANERVGSGGGEIDIDWIRSKRSIQFVRPRDRNASPVIWLASQ